MLEPDNFARRVLKRGPLLLLLLLLMPALSRADVKPAGLFCDGVVLQRDTRVPIWGTAEPGEAVSVSIGGQLVQTFAAEDGRWMARMYALPVGGPFELTIRGKNTVTIRNVAVGDVWLCSGQSNMAFRVAQAANAEDEIAAADFPMVRHFKVPNAVAESPVHDIRGEWKPALPENVGGFSAVAYYFGRELNRSLGVPIGLIHSSWGGTAAEAWTSLQALQADPVLRPILTRSQAKTSNYWVAMRDYEQKLATWKEAVARSGSDGQTTPRKPNEPENPVNRSQPGVLYNGMIAPLMPYAIKGVAWYQGEANADRPAEYRTLFPTLIRSWRAAWGRGDFPFLFVQLPNYMARRETPADSNWAELREAQQSALSLPATAMAVTIDVGEANDIHPKNKQDVGRRLAAAAMGTVYGRRNVYSGPIYDRMVTEKGAIRIYFRYSDGGLMTPGGAAPQGFAIAGEDGRFVWAAARIEGDSILVSSEEVPRPVAVRYAWANNPAANLYNGAGLPAAPFRTDTTTRRATLTASG